MTPSLVLAVAGGALLACGFYLMLERSLMRILAGIMLASNGVSLLYLVVSGPAGLAPIVGEPKYRISDPLPQAMVLTAIVITLATSAFLLAMSYRSFQLEGHDEVADDVEDRIVRRRADRDLTSESYTQHETDELPLDTETGGLEAAEDEPAHATENPRESDATSGEAP
ncbi:Na(+)/H(+) antiporter subunit C [Aestuariimicrobium soli]|uniref:Na(+)/H(+) antiporter subunit C n=1 Tax=Aestuariimicrobium soli TaxID=2035834 RepID=UPI003EBD621C